MAATHRGRRHLLYVKARNNPRESGCILFQLAGRIMCGFMVQGGSMCLSVPWVMVFVSVQPGTSQVGQTCTSR